MLYVSPIFLLSVLIAVAVYYIVPVKYRWLVLIFTSIGYYSTYGWMSVVFVTAVAGLTYTSARIINIIKLKTKDKSITKKRCKWIVFAVILITFGFLALIKFSGEIPHELGFIAPIGLSFYTFQTTGYLIDTYRGKYAPARSFPRFLLFAAFFPQTVQGPIGRYDDLAPQLISGNRWDDERAVRGVQLIIWGLFKKLLIADRLAVLANSVIGNFELYGGVIIFAGIIAYSVQIYCDFSGGIDISRGIALLFGIELEINFKQPFFASSIADFWRRWHITLGTWMKDYLFYPLILSKPMAKINKLIKKIIGSEYGRIVPVSISTFIVYFAVGMWHGAELKFIAFGIYNGVIITASLYFENKFAKIKSKMSSRVLKLWNAVAILRTFLLVCIGRYFTRADSLYNALRMLKRTLFSPRLYELTSGAFGLFGIKKLDVVIIFAGIAILFFADYMRERGTDNVKTIINAPAIIKYGGLLILLCAIVYFGYYNNDIIETRFIYAQY